MGQYGTDVSFRLRSGKAGELGTPRHSNDAIGKIIADGTGGIYRDNEKVPVLLKSEGYDITDEHLLGNFMYGNGERSAPFHKLRERIETTWEFPQMRTS